MPAPPRRRKDAMHFGAFGVSGHLDRDRILSLLSYTSRTLHPGPASLRPAWCSAHGWQGKCTLSAPMHRVGTGPTRVQLRVCPAPRTWLHQNAQNAASIAHP